MGEGKVTDGPTRCLLPGATPTNKPPDAHLHIRPSDEHLGHLRVRMRSRSASILMRLSVVGSALLLPVDGS